MQEQKEGKREEIKRTSGSSDNNKIPLPTRIECHSHTEAPNISWRYYNETWTLRAADQKYLESFEMWCCRRMEKISWTDHVRNEDVLLRINEQRNILHEIRKRKADWIGHILRRNCLLKQVIEGKIKGDGSDKKTRKKT